MSDAFYIGMMVTTSIALMVFLLWKAIANSDPESFLWEIHDDYKKRTVWYYHAQSEEEAWRYHNKANGGYTSYYCRQVQRNEYILIDGDHGVGMPIATELILDDYPCGFVGKLTLKEKK